MERSHIVLNEIIGVGQFGDVHIGTCHITPNSISKNMDSLSQQSDETGATNGSDSLSETNIYQVAVKTCKADADLITSEKFLEEACKYCEF